MRRALRGIVPPEILARNDKRTPDQAICHGIDKAWTTLKKLFDRSYLEQLGIVDERLVLEELNRVRYGVGYDLQSILRLISLEMWLRTLSKRRNRDTGRWMLVPCNESPASGREEVKSYG